MIAAQPWLPPTALFDGALTAAVENSVETWRSRWIASPRLCSVRLETCNAFDVLPRQGWRTTCGALAFIADAKMKTRLVATVLQSRGAARAVTAPDRTLLDALAEKICGDLLDQNCRLFGVATTAYRPLSIDTSADVPAPLMRFRMTGAGGTFGFLTVTAGAAAHARKSLAKPTGQKAPLEKRSRATARQIVSVGVHVGTGKVTVSDLATLAIGDVLVLDRHMTEPFDVTFNGRRPAARPAEVRRTGSALFIQTTRKHADGTA